MPYFWKQMYKRWASSLGAILLGLAFAFSLSWLAKARVDTAAGIEDVYDNMRVKCAVTNLKGTQSTTLALASWVPMLFMEDLEVEGMPGIKDPFYDYVTDVQAAVRVPCTLYGQKITLLGLTGLAAEPSLLAENGGTVVWREGFDESIFSGTEAVCLAPMSYDSDTVVFTLTSPTEETQQREFTVAGNCAGELFYCPWEVGREMSTFAMGYFNTDRISATFRDNRKIDEFWQNFGSRYFAEPNRTGEPTPWESSPMYVSYPYALAIYDDTLNATVEKLEKNQKILTAASYLVLAAAFGTAALGGFLTLRSRSQELKLQYIMGISQWKLLLAAVAEQGVLSLGGILTGAAAFALIFRYAPDAPAIGCFLVMTLGGTALAYAVTMNKQFLEANQGGE